MRLHCLWLLAIAVLIRMGAGSCRAAELSANLVSRSWMGVVTTTAKVYFKGDKIRIVYGAGQHSSSIIYGGREHNDVRWMLDPQNRTYTELNDQNDRWASHRRSPLEYLGLVDHDVSPMINGKKAGTESVNGYICQKFVYNILNKRGQIAAHWTQWYSSRLKIPIKLLYKSGNHTTYRELRNIGETKLKDSLFEIPASYTKIAPHHYK